MFVRAHLSFCEASGDYVASDGAFRYLTMFSTQISPLTGLVSNILAANARLSLYDGGQYLLARLDPATLPELSDAVKKFSNLLMDIGASATAGM